MTHHQLICIAGPTASGKTAIALKRAKAIGAWVISADSRMVFQGLDIGTGKPTWEYRQLPHSPWQTPLREELWGPVYRITGVDHHLLDVVAPETPWTLADWLKRVDQIRIAADKAKRPLIVVGGTGLYLKALLFGYQLPPTDPAVRHRLEAMETRAISEALQKVDPVTAAREQANRRRLIRALEVYLLTGQPHAVPRTKPRPEIDLMIVARPRAELLARIDERINDRLKSGMIEEVENLIMHVVSHAWLHQLGLEYRVITNWLTSEKKERSELVAQLRQVIHAYARRQETFLRTQFTGITRST